MAAKKKKKAKKKKRSVAWKGLEKYVAAFFGGIRILRGFNFSASLPDVIADGKPFGLPDLTIVVECKHSKTQPFVDLLKENLPDKHYTTLQASDGVVYVFWKLEETRDFLASAGNSFSKVDIDKDVPQYIEEHYAQAKGYFLDGLHPPGNSIFRMVVMAKKNSSVRVIYTTLDELKSTYKNCSITHRQADS